MGRRSPRDHRWAKEPRRLIAQFDPYDIWSKLNWEAAQYAALRAAEPPLDVDGALYLLENACISAVAAVEWLAKLAKGDARREGHNFDGAGFAAEVERHLPDLQLARAIANTFKHAEYRDEGWSDAEIRLEVLFTPAQRKRLDELLGTEHFEEVYAEKAANAGFQITFTRQGRPNELDADKFVADLDRNVLRLIDANYQDLDRFQLIRHASNGDDR